MIEWLSPDLLVAVPPPPKWIVQGLQLSPGRVSMVFGEKGTAKSLITCAAAVAVAAGVPVWGAFPVEPGKVAAIVDFEMGMPPLRRRVHGAAAAIGVNLRKLRGRLHLASRPKLDLRRVDDLVASFTGIDLAVIDTLAGATPDVDKNDERIRAYLDPLSEASDKTGCTFVLVHHEGMKKGRARGSSAIEDAAGAIFRVSGKDETRPRRITQTKTAVDAIAPIESLEVMVENSAVRVLGRKHDDAARAASIVPQVLESLRAWKGDRLPSKSELAKAIGGNREAVFAAIALAETQGAISSRREGTALRVGFPGTEGRSEVG